MGSCASVDKSRSGPAMKLVAFGRRADILVIPESPKKADSGLVATPPETVAKDGGGAAESRWSFSSAQKSLESPRKENSVWGDTPMSAKDCPIKSRWSFSSAKKSFGSKEEAFFDSQAWLESDDEFHSVNGDFTPSRGNTPKSGSFSERVPRLHNLTFEEKPLSPSEAPTPRRKKLAELFRDDSIREDSSEDSPENQSRSSEISSFNTPYVSETNSSVCSGELRAIEDSAAAEEKERKLRSFSPGCLPRFASCGSFSDRRKKTSLAATVAVK